MWKKLVEKHNIGEVDNVEKRYSLAVPRALENASLSEENIRRFSEVTKISEEVTDVKQSQRKSIKSVLKLWNRQSLKFSSSSKVS